MPSNHNPVFRHVHIIKLTRLMDMMYKPAELAEEIGISVDTIRRAYIPHGLPVTKDSTGHTWINGEIFKKWASETIAKRKKKKEKLPANKAYCVSCKKIVDFPAKPTKIIPVNRWAEIAQARCKVCGKTVNKTRGIIRK